MLNSKEPCFTAFIDYASGDPCGRKSFTNLYDAKLFIATTIFKWKHTETVKTFPFGFTYEVYEDNGATFNEQDLNLPY